MRRAGTRTGCGTSRRETPPRPATRRTPYARRRPQPSRRGASAAVRHGGCPRSRPGQLPRPAATGRTGPRHGRWRTGPRRARRCPGRHAAGGRRARRPSAPTPARRSARPWAGRPRARTPSPARRTRPSGTGTGSRAAPRPPALAGTGTARAARRPPGRPSRSTHPAAGCRTAGWNTPPGTGPRCACPARAARWRRRSRWPPVRERSWSPGGRRRADRGR
jgi:hypothetical protein